MEFLLSIFTDYTLRTVALGSGILGLVSGALGTFAVLRRQSLLGDAMSHAALPGIALAFLLTNSKTPLVLILGAAAAGWLGTLAIIKIVGFSRIKHDSALALVLSVFFGIGLVLLTYIQKQPNSAQAGLEKFLFGQAAALLERDLITMGILGIIALVCVILFWNQFKLLSFDPEFGRSLGLPMPFLDIILTSLLVIAIVIGLQTVGVVLMSAMIVAPAAGARQWTDRMGVMVILSAIFGAFAGIVGAIISSSAARIPTGPTIVLCISAIVFISITLAPNRGLVWNWVRQVRNRKKLQVDAILCDLYQLALQHGDPDHAHEEAALEAMSVSGGRGAAAASLKELENRGLAKKVDEKRWAITGQGLDEAARMQEDMGSDSR